MNNEMQEDFQDIEDIKRQKEESKRNFDEMPGWEPGKGLKKKEEKNINDIRSEI